MAEFPALPLWTDAYLADTRHLNDTEHGRYLMLLMLMWRTPLCRLPNDDAWLGRKLAKTPVEIVEQIRPLIQEFCRTDGNWITQKRLAQEFKYVTKTHERRSESAKRRWNKQKDLFEAY